MVRLQMRYTCYVEISRLFFSVRQFPTHSDPESAKRRSTISRKILQESFSLKIHERPFNEIPAEFCTNVRDFLGTSTTRL